MHPFVNTVLEHGPRTLASRARSLVRRPLAEGHVLMIHTGRSGSTVLGKLLDQHPAIFWDGETLEKHFHRVSRKKGVGVNAMYGEPSLDDAIALIRKRMSSLSGGRHFGLEVQDYHLKMIGTDCEAFLGELRRLGFSKFVILTRNPVRKLVSHVVATKRGQHHAQIGESVRREKVRINLDRVYVGHCFVSVEEVLEQFDEFFGSFEKLLANEDALRLSYADHVEESPLVAYDAICRYLGLEPQQPAITLRKTTQRDLDEVIENYGEFKERMLATRFRDDMMQVLEGKA